MKKLFIIALAFVTMSCTNELNEDSYNYKQEDYQTMLAFVQTLSDSDLFGVAMPFNPSYDELMLISAPVIMSDTFGDTLGEGDCEKVYFLMLDYFETMHPSAKVTDYLHFIISNELY